jgi:glycosyltransferase involved in cell wall biosynthesis
LSLKRKPFCSGALYELLLYTFDGWVDMMSTLRRIAFIGNSSPRRCGIATFTTDLQQAVAGTSLALDTCIIAMNDTEAGYDYPASVRFEINEGAMNDYVRAAAFINAGRYDIVSLQHEFGIFGGEAGGYVVELLSRLTMPIVTTLHTVLSHPSPAQRDVLNRIVDASAKVIVMAEKGRELLRDVYNVPANKIEVIAHGIPDFDFVAPDAAKAMLGYVGKSVILTFGLLNPNKGIEVMIEAMPAILERAPNAVYVVLGATHPNLVRNHGEAYREQLQARVRALGIAQSVVFTNQFVDLPTLLQFIAMCDVYATPYLNEAQMTSGTLAYSFGLGKAVVSTPYWHAQELLADGQGVLVPFNDKEVIGNEIASLLTNDAKRDAMRARAYTNSRAMTWARTALRYMGAFEHALRTHARARVMHRSLSLPAPDTHDLPALRTQHFLALCDDTGLFQHAVHNVPNRSHGYCVDDNARGLLLASALNAPGEVSLPERVTSTLAAFIQHAWNPDVGRFRNFMGFDRRWLEEIGSEDSHGRTLWALGACARNDASASRRRWAATLFSQALPAMAEMSSPRAWAFALLGIDHYLRAHAGAMPPTGWDTPLKMQRALADRLLALLTTHARTDWVWFESTLAYDNARLCEALIVTGASTRTHMYLDSGRKTLRWLMHIQTAPAGHFRPVGTEGFTDSAQRPRAFDQQPLEASAAIAACEAAWHSDGSGAWHAEAARAFAWFLGSNDLLVPVVDLETGSCCDGLHRDRPNENRGGESAVSYLLALVQMRAMARRGVGLALPIPATAESAERPIAGSHASVIRAPMHPLRSTSL